MPLIVGGSALPTDKHIHSAQGEIHKVIAKNGDVIWEMKTGPDKNTFVFFKGTRPSWYMYDSGGKTYIMVADHTMIYGVNHLGTDEAFEHNAVQIVKGHEYATDIYEIGLKLRKGHWGSSKVVVPSIVGRFAEIDFNGVNKGEGNGIKGSNTLGTLRATPELNKVYIHTTSVGDMNTEILQVYLCTDPMGRFKKWIVD